MSLVIPLSDHGGPLSRQIYLGLRQAILSGTFCAGDRLPATRDLAEQLGVSRTVILLAYDQLLAEGFIEGRSGSGTYVSSILLKDRPNPANAAAKLRLSTFGAAAADTASYVDFPKRRAPSLPYDFIYRSSGVDVFPFEQWRRILLRR